MIFVLNGVNHSDTDTKIIINLSIEHTFSGLDPKN